MFASFRLEGADAAPILNITDMRFVTMARRLRAEPLATRPSIGPGSRIGRFQVVSVLGRGGFASTYLGRHVDIGYSVALKVLTTTDRRSREELLREAQALAMLKHPGVVGVIDADIAESVPFLALEHVQGPSLRQALTDAGSLAPQRVLDLLEGLADVLVAQERAGVLHLDIKPDNIILKSGGTPCLIDYGLASFVTRQHGDAGRSSDVRGGTFIYMAPELIQGQADQRSDLYSLGATAWECLVGRPARSAPRPSSGRVIERTFSRTKLIASASLAQTPIPIRETLPHLDPKLARIIDGLTEPELTKRYQSAEDLASDIHRLRRGTRPEGPVLGTAFVAVPFEQRFDKPFAVVKRACHRAGVATRRLDQHDFSGGIWAQCDLEIRLCDLVVADFTSDDASGQPNPNVLTEAAHARALGKPLVVITRSDPESLPFDWRGTTVLKYQEGPSGFRGLSRALHRRVTALLLHERIQTASPWHRTSAPDLPST